MAFGLGKPSPGQKLLSDNIIFLNTFLTRKWTCPSMLQGLGPFLVLGFSGGCFHLFEPRNFYLRYPHMYFKDELPLLDIESRLYLQMASSMFSIHCSN